MVVPAAVAGTAWGIGAFAVLAVAELAARGAHPGRPGTEPLTTDERTTP